MSLIKCPECWENVSDKAEKCPNCGVKIKKGKIYHKFDENDSITS